jgi:hypothetical protein
MTRRKEMAMMVETSLLKGIEVMTKFLICVTFFQASALFPAFGFSQKWMGQAMFC